MANFVFKTDDEFDSAIRDYIKKCCHDYLAQEVKYVVKDFIREIFSHKLEKFDETLEKSFKNIQDNIDYSSTKFDELLRESVEKVVKEELNNIKSDPSTRHYIFDSIIKNINKNINETSEECTKNYFKDTINEILTNTNISVNILS